MQAPGFWDDQEAAQRTATAHKRAQERLTTFRAVESDAADLGELAELAADDAELAADMMSLSLLLILRSSPSLTFLPENALMARDGSDCAESVCGTGSLIGSGVVASRICWLVLTVGTLPSSTFSISGFGKI